VRASATRRALLVPVYEWCTEGFDTAVLQEARTLQEKLAYVDAGSALRVSVHEASARYYKHRRIEGANVLQGIALHSQ
jgi:hypothetical protein